MLPNSQPCAIQAFGLGHDLSSDFQVVLSEVTRKRHRVSWFYPLPLFGVLLLVIGCDARYHTNRIRGGNFRISDIQALASHNRDPNATATLASLLRHRSPAIRYFAAEALDNHLFSDADNRTESIDACHGLIGLLDDKNMFSYCLIGPLTSGCYRTGSVRARALLTLTHSFLKDEGFDKDAWMQRLNKRLEVSYTISRPSDSNVTQARATIPAHGSTGEGP